MMKSSRPTLKNCRPLAKQFVCDYINTNRQWSVRVLSTYVPADYEWDCAAVDLMDSPTVVNITRWLRSSSRLAKDH